MDTKKDSKTIPEYEVITSYVLMVIHTLKKGNVPLNKRNISSEVKMFYEKFGNDEVYRLANLIIKERK